MRPFVVACPEPAAQGTLPVFLLQHLGFREVAEDLPVQQLVLKPTVECLAVGVFPQAPRFDVQHLNPSVLQPFLHRQRDELRPVIRPHEIRPLLSPRQPPAGHHILGCKASLDVDRKTFPRELANHPHHLELPIILGLVYQTVTVPYMARVLRWLARARVLAGPQSLVSVLPNRRFQGSSPPPDGEPASG